MSIGTRIGVRSARIGAGIGGKPSSFWSVDATAGRGIPNSATQWAVAQAVAGWSGSGPSYQYRAGIVASGNLPDGISGLTLTKSAGSTVSYQQAIGGWTAAGLSFTTDVEGIFENTGAPDVGTTSYLLMALVSIASNPVGDPATIMRIGAGFGGDVALEVLANGHLNAKCAANATEGTAAPAGAVRRFFIRRDVTGNTCIGGSEQELITVAPTAVAGSSLTLGGNNIQTWFPPTMKAIDLTVWTGAAAERSSAQIKTLMQILGDSVAW